MPTRRLPQWSAALVVALLATAGAAHGQVRLPAAPGVWVATLQAVAPHTGGGTCALFVTRLGHRAEIACTVEGGAAPTTMTLFLDRFGIDGVPFATVAVSGGPAVSATLEHPPAAVTEALPTGVARVELGDGSGALLQGLFAAGDSTWTTVALDGTQVVPPTDSEATGRCEVAVLVTPPMVGVDCTHTVAAAQTLSLNRGGRGDTGDTLGEFAVGAGDLRPTVWSMASGDLVQAVRAESYYLQIGAGADAIRGQGDGCRRTATALCLMDRFEVTADGELGTDATRATGEAEPISDSLGLFRFRGTDGDGVRINTLSAMTVRVKDDCGALSVFTLLVTVNAGSSTVRVRDVVTGASPSFTITHADGASLLNQTALRCE